MLDVMDNAAVSMLYSDSECGTVPDNDSEVQNNDSEVWDSAGQH